MVCTRFAPSPTGYLHIGGVKIALICWIIARANNGKFILRVEDTDAKRSTDAAADAIIEGMQWLGLNYDESYFQSERLDLYRDKANDLIEQGKAYRCFCSKERLSRLKEEKDSSYDGHCRELNLAHSDSEEYIIRFKTPISGSVEVIDHLHGSVTFDNKELDDFVLLRSDGYPTYHLSVVVDDIDMKVTHVVRGDDHLSNTPKQINLIHAFGGTVPEYVHLPMILDEDGKKLSKRSGATNLLDYRENGYLPEAILNYLLRLGFSSKDKEIFSAEEMLELFNFSGLSKSASAINPEKLLWLNQHYIKTLEPSDVAAYLEPLLIKKGYDIASGPLLTELVVAQRDRVKTLVEMLEKSECFYSEVNLANKDNNAIDEFLNNESEPYLRKAYDSLSGIKDWSSSVLKEEIKSILKELDIKMPMLAKPLRVALLGTTVSPSLDITLALLGRDKTLKRLLLAIQWLEKA